MNRSLCRISLTVLSLILASCTSSSDSYKAFSSLGPQGVFITPIPSVIAGDQNYRLQFSVVVPAPLTFKSLSLSLSRDGGSSFEAIVDGLAGTESSYDWQVPGQNGSALIKLEGTDSLGNVFEARSNEFTIATDPVVTMDGITSAVRSGSTYRVSYRVKANGSPLSSLKLELSVNNGGSYSGAVNLSASASTVDYVIPTVTSNVSQAVFRISLADQAGKQASVTAGPFQILAVVASPIVRLLSPSITNQNAVSIGIQSCVGITKVLVNRQGETKPSDSNPAWVSCNPMVSYLMSQATNTVVAYALQVWAQDSVGNISAAGIPVSPSISYDTQAPVINISTPVPQIGAKSYGLTWTATDANFAAAPPVTVQYSKDGEAGLQAWTCTLTVALPNFTCVGSLPGQDTKNAVFKVTMSDAAGNSASKVSAPFTVLTTKPTISSFSLPDLPLVNGVQTTALPYAVGSISATGPFGVSGLSSLKFAVLSASSSCPTLPPTLSASNPYSTTPTIYYGSNGVVNVCAWVTDLAGNVSAPAPAIKVVFDSGYLSLPTVRVTAPVAGAVYGGSGSMVISWTCQPSALVGLKANPVSLQYMLGDDPTLYPVTSNPQPASGSFSWAPPASVTASTGFRILVSCADLAGVANNAFSQPVNSGDWSVFAGDSMYGLYGTSSMIADLISVGSQSSIGADGAGNIYYTMGQAILQVNSVTGLVSPLVGSIYSSGCSTSGSGSAFRMTNPVVIGSYAKGLSTPDDSILVLSCGNIYVVSAATGSATLWTSIATNYQGANVTSTSRYFLATNSKTREQSFIYVVGDGQTYTAVFKVSLTTAGNQPVPIHGGPRTGCPLDTTIKSYMTVGAPALGVPMPSMGQTPCSTDYVIFADETVSRIWLENYSNTQSVHGYRLDLKTGGTQNEYVIGSNDEGWHSANSALFCVSSPSNTGNVYCGVRTAGASINAYNFASKKWSRDCFPLDDPYSNDPQSNPYVCNDTTKSVAGPISGGVLLAPLREQLFAYYTGGTVKTVVPRTAENGEVNFEWVANVAGQVVSTAGNSSLSPMRFERPTGMQYVENSSTGTKSVVVRSPGYVSYLDITNPGSVHKRTVSVPDAFAYSYTSAFSLSPNAAGEDVLLLTSCAQYYLTGGQILDGIYTSLGVANQYHYPSCRPFDPNAAVYPPVSGSPANGSRSPGFGATISTTGSAVQGVAGVIPSTQAMVLHRNAQGSPVAYFAANTDASTAPKDTFIFRSNRQTIDRVAGKVGVGAYVPTGTAGVAADATSLTHVSQMQIYEKQGHRNSGDLLLWDCYHLRLASVVSEAANPRIYDLADLSSTLNGGSAGCTTASGLVDAFYDASRETGGPGTGVVYYVMNKSGAKVAGWVHLGKGTKYEYRLNGTNSGLNGSSYVRLAVTPSALLLLQPTQARILSLPLAQ